MNTLYIIAVIPLLIGVFGVFLYNSLVLKRNRVRSSWSDIEAQLKRRYDLIPNLIETVKGSSKFESETLEKVISARAKAMQGGDHEALGKVENELSGTLKSIFALAESYPDLKSNQNYLSLQNELSDTENKIQYARRFFNENVMEYNTALQTVPVNIIGGMFHFEEEKFFALDNDAAKEPVKVSF